MCLFLVPTENRVVVLYEGEDGSTCPGHGGPAGSISLVSAARQPQHASVRPKPNRGWDKFRDGVTPARYSGPQVAQATPQRSAHFGVGRGSTARGISPIQSPAETSSDGPFFLKRVGAGRHPSREGARGRRAGDMVPWSEGDERATSRQPGDGRPMEPGLASRLSRTHSRALVQMHAITKCPWSVAVGLQLGSGPPAPASPITGRSSLASAFFASALVDS